jgi:syntaxin-binding protein 1
MELGIIALEKLELGRKPFPKMHVVYFITPSESSITHLLSDYSDKKNPQYGVVHLIFSNDVPQPMMQKIATSEPLITRVLTFKIFNLDFACAAETVFSLEMSDALTCAFSTKGIN